MLWWWYSSFIVIYSVTHVDTKSQRRTEPKVCTIQYNPLVSSPRRYLSSGRYTHIFKPDEVVRNPFTPRGTLAPSNNNQKQKSPFEIKTYRKKEADMVYYFTSNVVDPPATIYVGKDKFESLLHSFLFSFSCHICPCYSGGLTTMVVLNVVLGWAAGWSFTICCMFILLTR